MATQWPVIAAGLVPLLKGLSGWAAVDVYDGPPPLQTLSASFAIVGHTLTGGDTAGNFTTIQHPNGFQRIETGVIACQVTCQTGAGAAVAGMRTATFALIDALETYIRGSRTLGGLLSTDGTSDLTVDVLTEWNPNGTAQSLNFQIAYYTVT